MKKVLASMVAVGCFAVAGTAFAGIGATTGVNGSLHDMNMIIGPTADSMGRVCVFCHTPHHAQVVKDGDRLPLWNHQINAKTDYAPYIWATPLNSGDPTDATTIDVVAGPSRLCMSCHDGSIAVDEHGATFAQALGTKNISQIQMSYDFQGRANLTKNLSDTHPIGFDYNKIATWRNTHAQNASNDGTVGGSTFGTEIVESVYGYATDVAYNDDQLKGYNVVTHNTGGKIIKDNLFGGATMTCATCHEVHNKENVTQAPFTDGRTLVVNLAGGKTVNQLAPNYFLYAKEDKSLICLSCHVK